MLDYARRVLQRGSHLSLPLSSWGLQTISKPEGEELIGFAKA